MDVKLQRKIDQVLGSWICRILSFYNSIKPRPQRPDKIRSILIILLSEMGSIVLAYPMFRRLKEKYPEAEISFLLFKKNREILEILDIVPDENIFTIDNSSLTGLATTARSVLGKLRRKKFDAVIDCELFHRISSIFSFLSGAPLRAGFHRHTQEGLYRGGFINCPVMYNPYRHISRQFINLAESLDTVTTFPRVKRLIQESGPMPPKTKFTSQEKDAFFSRLESGGKWRNGKKTVLIYPGGGLLPIRAWPLEYFCRLSGLILEAGYSVSIIGLKEDREIAEIILSRCSHEDCIDLTGFTRSIRELLILFNMASLLITNDGGPGHFAVLTSVPTIVFFGPETHLLYGPLDEKTHVFFPGIACAPCLTAYNHRNSPCDGDNRCLKSIGVEEVYDKAMEILG